MTPNESFKNALKIGNLADALVIALSKATELKITTSIVSANDYYGKNPYLHPEDCLETKINLLKGEIDNKIGENILKNESYETLQKIHLEEAIESNKLIQNNIETLQKLFTILADLKQQQLEIKNPEVVSLYLGNQLPPPPPPPVNYTSPLRRESTTHQNNPTIVSGISETDSSSEKKPTRQKIHRKPNYDWKTLAESMIESEPTNLEKEAVNISSIQEEIDEDWGDLIMEEEAKIKPPVVKEKNINTDTTVVSNQEINNLITEQNIDLIEETFEVKKSEPEEDIIEHLSIEDDQMNLDTKVISETEIHAFLAEEQNRRILSANESENSNIKNEEITAFINDNYQLNLENQSISENEINELLANEDWGDLLDDGNEEEINTSKTENNLNDDLNFSDTDDDWDDVIEELYEPKIPSQNEDK
jgi:hypothetical protein